MKVWYVDSTCYDGPMLFSTREKAEEYVRALVEMDEIFECVADELIEDGTSWDEDSDETWCLSSAIIDDIY